MNEFVLTRKRKRELNNMIRKIKYYFKKNPLEEEVFLIKKNLVLTPANPLAQFIDWLKCNYYDDYTINKCVYLIKINYIYGKIELTPKNRVEFDYLSEFKKLH